MERDEDLTSAGTTNTTAYSELEIASMAAAHGTSGAAVIRQSMAVEALCDEDWMASYRARRSADLPSLDTLPVFPPRALAAASALATESATEAFPARNPNRFEAPLAGSALGALTGLVAQANPLASNVSNLFDQNLVGVNTGTPGHFLAVCGAMAVAGAIAQLAARNRHHLLKTAAFAWASLAIHPLAPLLVIVFELGRLSLSAIRSHSAGNSKTGASAAIRPQAAAPSPSWIDATPRTRWGAPVKTTEGASFELAQRAASYGCEPCPASVLDQVAAVLGAEAWFAATCAESFEQAQTFGPSAMGGLAAVYARAAGHGADALSPLPGEPAWPAQEERLRVLLEDPMRWAIRQLGPFGAADALRLAASDLSYSGGGADRCTRAARWMVDHSYLYETNS